MTDFVPERIAASWRYRLDQVRHIGERLADTIRELRYLSPSDVTATASDLARHIEGQVMKDYHRIEKALSLRETRPEFGAVPRKRLDVNLTRADSAAIPRPILEAGRTVAAAHDEWQRSATRRPIEEGGVVWQLDSHDASSGLLSDPERFFTSRRSVRDFDSERIPDRETLERIVRLAQTTPSVCNRQGVSVNLYTKKADVLRILELQGGSRGFRELVPALYVVHVDSRLFSVVKERDQRWIDGGLFAMTLVLATHALGLASCVLNWSVNNRLHKRMQKRLGLPPYQSIVLLMAVGYPPQHFRAARSLRRSLDEVLTVDPPLAD